MAAASAAVEGGKADGSNVRLDRFSDALEKFLKAIDERANKEGFRTALPDIDEKVLESARKQLVFHLKDAIKVEKDRLVESYELDSKLAELEELTREADKYNARHGKSAKKPKDAWRPRLDLAAAMSAPSVAVQRETNAALEAELEAITADNKRVYEDLSAIMADSESQRHWAQAFLDTLDETVAALETTPKQAEELRAVMSDLAAELGPRGLAA